MFKELEIMEKTLRYLLIAVTVLSVLSLSAQTHQYTATHSQEQTTYTMQVNPQMPAATMDYRHSDYMTSGSTLPQAAVDGPTTTYDEGNNSPHKGHMRRVGDDDGFEDEDDPDNPGEPFPIGDAGWTLLALAAAYAVLRVYRRKRSV